MTEPNAFTSTLSLAVHEFRTPVTVALGYLRMLLNEQQAGPLTERQRKLAQEADQACQRIGALVGDMSDLSKIAARELALERQEIDVNALLLEVASHMHEGADRGVRLEVRASEHAAMMTGDRARISAALSALIHAALRELGEPGTVVAQCFVVRESDTTWAVVAIGREPLLAGLASAHRAPPPFDEFIYGLGLVLPLARRVIEAHGGAVWSAGGSSRAAVALRLPLRAQDA